ncbi:MAG: hypothetical protein R2731_07975 [Nocardioides sp.]
MTSALPALLPVLLLGFLTVTSVALSVPQLVRLIRSGDPAGLSGSSLLFGTANYTAWSVYLAGAQAWGLLAANLVASLVWYAVVALALRGLRPRRTWWVPAWWAVALASVAVLAPALLGAMLGFGSLLTYTPQAVGVWRAISLAGVSPATWTLTAAEGLAWLAQSVRDGLAGGVLSGLIATAAAGSVLLALAVRGRAEDRSERGHARHGALAGEPVGPPLAG